MLNQAIGKEKKKFSRCTRLRNTIQIRLHQNCLALNYRVDNRVTEPNYFHLPSDNSEWLGFMTVVYVQSYKRRGLSVNAEIFVLYHMEWYIFKVTIFFAVMFFFYCHVFHYDFECTNIFFLSIHTPRSQKYIGIM